MDTHELLLTALRGAGVYMIMLIVIRLLGKRTVGNFSAFDLLVALMLGEVVDEIIYGDVPFVQGMVSIVVITALKILTTWLSYRNQKASSILEGVPTKLVEHGELFHEGMRKEWLTEADVEAFLRLEGVEDMREVKIANMEVDGQVSVIKENWAEPLQKADVIPYMESARKKSIGSAVEPPGDKKTPEINEEKPH